MTATVRRGRPPRSEGPDGRTRLINAAREVFGARGYAGATVGDLVAAAGVSDPTLYHHFDGKAGLFVAAAEDAYGAALERFGTAVAGETQFERALDKLFTAAVDLMDTERVLARMLLVIQVDYLRHPELTAGLRPLLGRYRAFFDSLAALAPAELAPTRRARVDLSRALISLLAGLNSQALLLPDAADFAGLVRSTRALLGLAR
jgi:AcrR family transcriptional regulator